jgi:hypothetical protein
MGQPREGSVGLLKTPFWAAVFYFHGDFDKVGNYHVTTLRLTQMNSLSGNLACDPEYV